MTPLHRTSALLAGVMLASSIGIGIVRAETHAEFHERPIPMGVSISTTPSTPFIFAGTAGMRVRSLFFPSLLFILSNHHVMGAIGPDLCPGTAPVGTSILQPGTLDIGFDPGPDPALTVGWLLKAAPIQFGLFANNTVDAAIAFTTRDLSSNEILGIGVPRAGLVAPAPGMKIWKSGRTTGVTTGRVLAVDTTVLINYGSECGGLARFQRQIITSAGLGAPGDSGSAVLERASNVPVGLYFAGSPFFGIMNDILTVYLKLGVFVDGLAAPAAGAQPESTPAPAAGPIWERARAAQQRHEARLLRIAGVRGVGLGRNEADGSPELVVFCRTLGPTVRARVPRTLDGYPVRLLESGEFVPH